MFAAKLDDQLDPWNLDAGRRDVSPVSGPLIPTLTPWHENCEGLLTRSTCDSKAVVSLKSLPKWSDD